MDSYFKVDKRIYALTNNMISEKAFKLYILYCNEVNLNKYLGCALMGARQAKKVLGLEQNIFKKAQKELIDKHFITLRPDVKTGYLTTVAVEVLEFLDVNKKTKKFTANSQIHRDYPKGKYLNIPKAVMSYIKFLNFDTVMLLLELYNNIVDGIVNINYAYVYCRNNPLGYSLQGDRWAKADTEAAWYFTANRGGHINQLIDLEIFYTQYALVYEDANDKEYRYIKTMLQQTNDNNEDYIFLKPYSKNERVIKVLIPVHKLEFPARKEADTTETPNTTA